MYCMSPEAQILGGGSSPLGPMKSAPMRRAYCYRRSSVVCLVGLSVHLVTIVSPAKTAETIQMPFGM